MLMNVKDWLMIISALKGLIHDDGDRISWQFSWIICEQWNKAKYDENSQMSVIYVRKMGYNKVPWNSGINKNLANLFHRVSTA